MPALINLSHYLPIFSTIISAIFAWRILSRYRLKPGAMHLLWWGVGVAVYGVGTLVESLTTIFGWHEIIFRAWYISGALLGGAPLALGTIYLLMGRTWGRVSTIVLLVVVGTVSVFVILSPIKYDLVDPEILSSSVLGWQSIRLVSPVINSLAAIFLIGGAIYSAVIGIRRPETRNRGIGNIYIAAGALLPGIGGMMSRMGHTEGLYVGELIGIILIWIGYKKCQRDSPNPIYSYPLYGDNQPSAPGRAIPSGTDQEE